ncbi:MAG: DUF6029 family protein [Cytophagaceae bacterium]|jgi:hypothetical protein|nr:DUF6029 family protein [Cytophagaceae bacterium]
MKHIIILVCVLTLFSVQAQEKKRAISVNGNIQSDILFPEEDTDIGASSYEEAALTNTYLDLNLMSTYVNAGGRFEFLKYPLPGFEPDFAGWGVPYFYLTGNYKKVKLTVGDFYDQFGSGFIFRSYQERSLGIDNAIRGARLSVEPFKGVNLKALGGQQRRYFDHNSGYLAGGDVELNFDQWFSKMQESNTFFMLGGSFITKNENTDELILTEDGASRLNLPENVAAYDIRARLQKGNYSFLLEYASKINDPSRDNYYIYKNGTAWLFSSSYAKRGMSILLQAKRSDNMSFRSRRSELAPTASFINHLPPFSMQQTYALAALYPYATQPLGEWAFQGTFAYGFRRNTLLGGKYGTNIKVNASHIRSIDKQYVDQYVAGNYNSLRGSDGYASSFFKMGNETYYQDINIAIDKKFTQDFKLNLMYINLLSNEWIIRQHGTDDDRMLQANIFIGEGKYQISPKVTVRSELQYLATQEDEGDWVSALIEVSLLPSFMFTVSDMYNAGETKLHYYKALVTYTLKSHLFQLGYGRSRAGYDCSGGICRVVPASRGFQFAYNYNF